MKRKLLTVFIVFLTVMAASAQDDGSVIMTVGNEKITRGEFIKAYQKNSSLSEASEKDLREYLNLYSEYKMKVQEAKALKLDTAQSFQKEWSSYKSQYAQQYLIDTEVSDQLLEETYGRARYHVRASHLLVRLDPEATAKDTVAAYHKIMKIRDEIVGGLDFNEAAAKYSEDQSARDFVNPQTKRKQKGNRGELGYFSVLEMIYPFETAAYNTPVGMVSMPVRTQFGYHLIYVQDKIPAIAKIYVSQIFFSDTTALDKTADHSDVMARYREVQRRFNAGTPFSELAAEFSDDNATKNNGGRMEPCSPNRRPGNFLYTAINVPKNRISEPVPSAIGWHILQLDSVVYTSVNDEFKYMLKNKLSRDARSKKSKESLVEKLKKEYGYEESGKKAAMKFFKKSLPANYFQTKNVEIDSLKGIEKLRPMCTFAGNTLTASDFGKFISRYQGMQIKTSQMAFIEDLFPNFVSEKMLAYERTQLMTKYPEYREVVNEVYDGLMIYEVNSLKVWNAAIKDTVGAERFYESIKQQFATGDTLKPYKTFDEVRAIVVSQYQDVLEKQWLKELHEKYPVKLDEAVFRSILKK
ncbi:MAG: peptidylprolyl isomerase [Bacteroidales bacterium]|nr:peptidylprolyl isomerase [Bacteroidales bacterium]MDY6348272.1 peptidylprolyl isomerase [Bacteroidales bacterium]